MDKIKIIKRLDKIIDWLLAAIIFLTPVVFAFWEENYSVFELNKLVVIRTGLTLVLALWLTKLSLGGAFVRYPRKFYLISGALLAAYLLNGFVFAVKPQFSLWGNYDRQQGVYSLVYYWLFFILVSTHLSNWRQLKLWLISVLSGSTVVVIYGLLQTWHLDPYIWAESTRAFANLGQPNFFGHYLVMIIPLSILAWWLTKNKFCRWLLIVLLLGQFLVLGASLSRSAWLALLGGTTIILTIYFWFKQRRWILIIWLLLAVFLAGIFIFDHYDTKDGQAIWWGLPRFTSSFNPTHVNNKVRLLYWSGALNKMWQSPVSRQLIGYGKDSQSDFFQGLYQREWGYYEALNSFPDRAHNIFIDALIEFGLLGLILIVWFNLFFISQIIKYFKKADWTQSRTKIIFTLAWCWVNYWLAGLFGFPLTTHYLYYFGCLAVLGFLLIEPNKEISLVKTSSLFRWLISGSIILFFVFFLYFFTIKAYRADIYYMQAKRGEVKGDCAQMTANMALAVDNLPVSTFYKEKFLFMYNNCLPGAGNNAETMMAMEESILDVLASYPKPLNNYHILMNQSHIYSVLGYYRDKKYYDQADASYRELIKLNPYITVNYQDYGRMKMWAGKFAEAIAIWQEGLKMTPPLDDGNVILYRREDVLTQTAYFWELIGQAYRSELKWREATEAFEKVRALRPEYIMVYHNLAEAYEAGGQEDKAKEALLAGRQLKPDDPAWSYNLADLQQKMGNWQEAMLYAEESLKLNPTDQMTIDLVKKIKSKK